MKKLISLFLAVVMVFSLTVPVLAAEPVINGSTSGEVTANFDPNIEILSISFTGDIVTYDPATKTYTVVIPAGVEAFDEVYGVTNGINLNYIPADDETYLVKIYSYEGGELLDETELPFGMFVNDESDVWIYDETAGTLTQQLDGSTDNVGYSYGFSFSNDGGKSWSEPIYYVVKQAYAISVGTSGESGTVSVMGGKTSAVEGETVELIVDTGVGYELDELTVKYTDEEGNEQEAAVAEDHTFVMPAADVTVNATFVESVKTYTVEISATEGGDVSIVDAKEAYHHNDDVTLSIIPTEGYELESLTITYVDENGDQKELHYTNTYTFVMPAANVTVTATFKQVYNISINVTGKGSVTTDKSTAAAGEAVTLTIAPDAGYVLYYLYVDNQEVAVNENTYTFTMPEKPVSVHAIFERTGKALDTLYVKNTGSWEEINVHFYTDSVSYYLDSATLTIVGSETDIYHTTAIPEFAYKVQIEYTDGADSEYSEIMDLPTDGVLNQYNPNDGTWTEFVPTSQTTIGATIAWGSMAFTYTDENGWTNDGENGGKINVTNSGTPTFTAAVAYNPEESYREIEGTFDVDSATLESGHYKTFTLTLSGTPNKAIPEGTKIGSVTVTIE